MLLKPGTENGNGERGTVVWERVYSGNPYKNSKKAFKCNLKSAFKVYLRFFGRYSGLSFITRVKNLTSGKI